MTNVNKNFFASTENLLRLAVLIVGLIAAVFGLPEDLASELESAVVEAITAVSGLVAVILMVWSFINEQAAMRTVRFESGFSNISGWKTPEFWIAIAGTLIGFLVLFGVITEPTGNTLAELIAIIIEALFAIFTLVAPTLLYARSRRKVKQSIAEHAL